MSEGADIKTFVVLDLEVDRYPAENFNTCSITEYSMCAFSAQCLKEVSGQGVVDFQQELPELPRVLHKMTLMIRPSFRINQKSESGTGLSNEMLENESPFNEETATCINKFLERLQAPVCLVAHNGWTHDFAIIRHVYEKCKKLFPSSIFCVDSIKAFREIDEKLKMMLDGPSTSNPLEENAQIDWQHINETSPQKRGLVKPLNSLSDTEPPAKKSKVKSLLFDDDYTLSKYPPKDKYKLCNIYKRCFKRKAYGLHHAEKDVEALTKVIFHYGKDFLDYAQKRKQLFTNVPILCSSTN